MSDPDPSEYDEDTLTFFCDEARTVLDHQIEILADIDQKAMRTVRFTALLLGILFSAVNVAPETFEFNLWLRIGGALLLGSLVSAVVTYTASYPELGPGPAYLDDVLSQPKDETRWRIEMLRSYADWMHENDVVNRRNGLYLLISQICLTIGLVSTAVGVLVELQ